MALTSTTIFDVVGQTQTITFYEGASQVDQILFSSNQITFETAAAYNLAKSDYLLYFKYLNAYFSALFINFPSISSSSNAIFPLCTFSLTETSVGVTHINYLQNTGSTLVLGINYVPVALAAAFTARTSPVTISMQEFFMMINMLSQFTNQVSLN
jgi:hypothetical protein